MPNLKKLAGGVCPPEKPEIVSGAVLSNG